MTSVATPARDHGRQRAFAVWAVLLAMGYLLVMMGATDAQAARNYAGSGPFGSSVFSGPTKVAVDDATGNVLVVDSGNNQIQVWGPGGSASTLLTTFGAGDLSSPYGIAVDQTSHAVYVTDAVNNKVRRYTTDGLPVPTYTLDITYSGPPAAAGPPPASGQIVSFASPIAVDPTNGDLLIADTGYPRVSRYTSGGSFVGSFNGADTAAGAFTHLLDIAVDAGGGAYVIDFDGYIDPNFGNVAGTSRVEQFDAGGASLGRLDAGTLNYARSVTVDLGSDNVIVASQGGFFALSTLHPYHGGLLLGDIAYPAGTESSGAVGLAVDGVGGRLYALTTQTVQCCFGVDSVQVFDPVPLPTLLLDAPTAIGQSTAHISGSVDPVTAGLHTKYQFELNDGHNWTPVGSEVEPTGAVTIAAHHDLVDLVPNIIYNVRLRGTNDNGTIYTPARSFTTLQSAPDVDTDPATDRTTTGATLRGFVTPYGLQTTYHFEYGSTTAYGSRAPASSERTAGDGYSPRHAQYSVSGLQPGLTYHYRLVARNSAGETAGPDRTFATVAGPDHGRVYEMVSPADKGGANVQTVQPFQASADGDRLAYYTTTGIPGLGDAAPGFPRYLATRGGDGWSTSGIDPPQLREDKGLNALNTLAVSEDGSKALVFSLQKLADGAVTGVTNMYLKDLDTGTYVTVATEPGTRIYEVERDPANADRNALFVAGTRDFSHIVLYAQRTSFLPGAPVNAYYEFSAGVLRLVSIAPNDTAIAVPNGGGGDPSTISRDPHRISDDGSRIVFFAGGTPVYVRLDGTTTLAVSASERAGDGGAARPAQFLAASADGAFVFILAQDLTDDSSPGAWNIYRYDVDARQLALVVANATTTDRAYQLSRDGTTLYFLSSSALAPGGVGTGGNNIYVWRAGQGVRLVATLNASRDMTATGVPSWRASPNGRYFTFAAYSQLTAYDNASTACTNTPEGDPGGACREIYRYDAETTALECASCRPDGRSPTGNARIAPVRPDVGGVSYPRTVLDDGRVFFDTPDPLASHDTNSTRDVYLFDGTDATLISAGRGASSLLAGVSADGRDVFFTTQDQLVSQDRDSLTDVYDARVGGAIENATSPDMTCSGEDCRGATPGPVAPDESPSQRLAGANHAPVAPAKARVTITSAKFAGTLLRLTVNVSGAGRVRASGAKVIAATRTTSKSGRYAVELRMTKKQRALRRAGRTVRAAITVSFTPVYGQRVTTHITRTAAR